MNNINVQQQSTESQLEWLNWKENIKEVENQVDAKLKKLEENPEQKKWIINWIKEKLWLNKDDFDDQTAETVKNEVQETENIVDNQGGWKLDNSEEKIIQ